LPFYQTVESIELAASPEAVYRALTDWKARSLWRPGLRVTWDGPDQAAVGQCVSFKLKGFPAYGFTYRIAGLEPPSRIYLEYLAPPLKGRAAIEITAGAGNEGTGCRVAFHWMKVEPVGFLASLAFALGWGLASHRRQTRKTFQYLKQSLEKAPARA